MNNSSTEQPLIPREYDVSLKRLFINLIISFACSCGSPSFADPIHSFLFVLYRNPSLLFYCETVLSLRVCFFCGVFTTGGTLCSLYVQSSQSIAVPSFTSPKKRWVVHSCCPTPTTWSFFFAISSCWCGMW